MARAFYHQSTGRTIELDVLKTHKDGTVDLGRDDKVMVAKCPVSEEAKVGHATLQKEKKAATGPKPTKAELKAAATATREAATAARKAADAAPDDEALEQAAKDAEAAAAAAEEAAK